MLAAGDVLTLRNVSGPFSFDISDGGPDGGPGGTSATLTLLRIQ